MKFITPCAIYKDFYTSMQFLRNSLMPFSRISLVLANILIEMLYFLVKSPNILDSKKLKLVNSFEDIVYYCRKSIIYVFSIQI